MVIRDRRGALAVARAQEAQLREAKEKEKDRLAKQLEKDSLKGKHWSEKASPAPALHCPHLFPMHPALFVGYAGANQDTRRSPQPDALALALTDRSGAPGLKPSRAEPVGRCRNWRR